MNLSQELNPQVPNLANSTVKELLSMKMAYLITAIKFYRLRRYFAVKTEMFRGSLIVNHFKITLSTTLRFLMKRVKGNLLGSTKMQPRI